MVDSIRSSIWMQILLITLCQSYIYSIFSLAFSILKVTFWCQTCFEAWPQMIVLITANDKINWKVLIKSSQDTGLRWISNGVPMTPNDMKMRWEERNRNIQTYKLGITITRSLHFSIIRMFLTAPDIHNFWEKLVDKTVFQLIILIYQSEWLLIPSLLVVHKYLST